MYISRGSYKSKSSSHYCNTVETTQCHDNYYLVNDSYPHDHECLSTDTAISKKKYHTMSYMCRYYVHVRNILYRQHIMGLTYHREQLGRAEQIGTQSCSAEEWGNQLMFHSQTPFQLISPAFYHRHSYPIIYHSSVQYSQLYRNLNHSRLQLAEKTIQNSYFLSAVQ